MLPANIGLPRPRLVSLEVELTKHQGATEVYNAALHTTMTWLVQMSMCVRYDARLVTLCEEQKPQQQCCKQLSDLSAVSLSLEVEGK